MILVIGFVGFFMIFDYLKLLNFGVFWFSVDYVVMVIVCFDWYGWFDIKCIIWDSVKWIFFMWIVYFIFVFYIVIVLVLYGYNYFNLFFKSLKNFDGILIWIIEEVNVIFIVGGVINIVCGEFFDFCVWGCYCYVDFNQFGYG